MPFVKLREAVARTGLHPNTLRKYADEKQISTIRTPSKQRLFDVDSFLREGKGTSIVCYARVSSAKQRADLDRQVAALSSHYPKAEIVTDVGSGLNFKRKGLKALLERSLSGNSITVVVAHRDRLCRFGFDLLSWLFERSGGSVVVLNDSAAASPQAELVHDLLAVLGVFSARMHGLRKYRKAVKEDPNLSDEGAAKDVSDVVRDVP
jgi:predicted site-specific integrase-resolvase